ncbi:MAG: Lrp/AsnC family transcriptional regulator [Actinomycetia bacterium]|nr:Lrp/AsnC family transcriptional regulator [Actinomycetes bacterium]MCP5030620.1 Lrp/AsnC family transcriptional regulator [Actinomycetes bacterium]
MELDATDLAIISILQHEGRVTNAELADRVGLSPSACLRRVRSLENEDVIDRYVALVNPAAVGRATSVFVEISLASQTEAQLDEFEAAIGECPEVMSCHLMSGESDYLVHLACADVGDYERIHRTRLAILPGVSRLRSSFAIRQVCDRTGFQLGPYRGPR